MSFPVSACLHAAGVFFLIALVGSLYALARGFVRRSQDNHRWREHRLMPWWASLALGLSFLFAELASYLQFVGFMGIGVVGAFCVAVGLIGGYRADWRIWHLFDLLDADARANHFPGTLPRSRADGSKPAPYEIPTETLRRNGRMQLGAAVAFAIAAYVVLAWGRSFTGEQGFGGLAFTVTVFLLALLAVTTGLSGVIAWSSYLLRRRKDEDQREPLDWSWLRIGKDAWLGLAMLAGGIAIVLLRVPLGWLVGWPLVVLGLWRLVLLLLRRAAERGS